MQCHYIMCVCHWFCKCFCECNGEGISFSFIYLILFQDYFFRCREASYMASCSLRERLCGIITTFSLCFYFYNLCFCLKMRDTVLQIGASYVDRMDFSDHHVFQARVKNIFISAVTYILVKSAVLLFGF